MILLIDHHNRASRVAAVSRRAATWFVAPPGHSAVDALAAARRRRAFSAGTAGIGVVMARPGVPRDVSWSGVRSAVAASNALAFALGIPAVPVFVDGTESDESLADAARAAFKGAKRGDTVAAAYDGAPNISTPKSAV